MARWKLCRQTYTDDIHEFKEDDVVTIGRGAHNTIVLHSLNISREHCVIQVKKDEVIITDLQSANGIFVGLKKISSNVPFSLHDNDIIGLGWIDGAPLASVKDSAKFVYKLLKVPTKTTESLELKTENGVDRIEAELALMNNNSLQNKLLAGNSKHHQLNGKPNENLLAKNLSNIDFDNNRRKDNDEIKSDDKKIKFDFKFKEENQAFYIKTENEDLKYEAFNIKQECIDEEPIIIDSDSDSEQWYAKLSQNSPIKSSSFIDIRKSGVSQQDSSYSQLDDDVICVNKVVEKISSESEDEKYVDDLITILPPPVEYKVKSYDNIEKCNDNKNENKNYKTHEACNISKKKDITVHEPLDRDIKKVNEILPKSTNQNVNNVSRRLQLLDVLQTNCKNRESKKQGKRDRRKSSSSSKIHITNSQKEARKKKLREIATKEKDDDEIFNPNLFRNEEASTAAPKVNAKVTSSNRGAFLILTDSVVTKPAKSKVLDNKESISEKESISDEQINGYSSKKEKRKSVNNKIKDQIPILINKKKDKTVNTNSEVMSSNKKSISLISKPGNKAKSVYDNANGISTEVDIKSSKKINVEEKNNLRNKTENLTNKALSVLSPTNIPNNNEKKSLKRHYAITKDIKAKESRYLPSVTNKRKKRNSTNKDEIEELSTNSLQYEENLDTLNNFKCQLNIKKIEKSSEQTISKPLQKTKANQSPEAKSPFKPILKGIKDCNNHIIAPKNRKKSVRFSDAQPEVREFQIEPGHEMKKTSSVKNTLIPMKHNEPVMSLERLALMKILRWNPQWLEEQNNQDEPPPILGHNNVPVGILHSYSSHMQYVEVIGDLLIMEIWECLTQGYKKTRHENMYHQMRIESLPLVPLQKSPFEFINISVNVSLPTVQANLIPREGEIVMIHFGEDVKNCRFFFVNNVKCLPSPPNNINSFYSISLQTSFTEKIQTLQRGAIMFGKSLAYINKDLRLFEAMEYLCKSPLNEVILTPKPKHFIQSEINTLTTINMESQWVKPLNDSQKKAVMNAVSAAMEDTPRIHMVQGPPGTGKSRVICAMVMAYFYDAAEKKQKNRGKILICATSNAAVDELVIRLLDIRQSLPHPERLNMVRVGRVEAMHPRARDISSVRLAQRDAARLQPDPAHAQPAVTAEISILEAKANMWQSKEMSAVDAARKAYCHSRVEDIKKKIALFYGSSGGAACAPELTAMAERRVLDCADVVFTTLASAHTHKMRVLARRIALCIVDEAGQAIEPETLVPLTLDVTRLVLIGDPQQLPGFIFSQRAKKLGLNQSLFSRLSSCTEAWAESAPVLLDRQYRMHPHIADYPNRAFYDGQVRNESPRPLALPVAPYFVLSIVSGENGQDATGANEAEAWGAARVALALRGAAPAASLAVITPYAAQRDLVRRQLRVLSEWEKREVCEVEVNTVDSFQGQERDIVVVSLARSNGLGFLADAGRMNVMLTRARHALVLCLNPSAVEKNQQWRSLVEDAQKRNLFRTLPIHACKHPLVQHVSNKEILEYLNRKPITTNIVDKPHPSTGKSRRSKRRRTRRGPYHA